MIDRQREFIEHILSDPTGRGGVIVSNMAAGLKIGLYNKNELVTFIDDWLKLLRHEKCLGDIESELKIYLTLCRRRLPKMLRSQYGVTGEIAIVKRVSKVDVIEKSNLARIANKDIFDKAVDLSDPSVWQVSTSDFFGPILDYEITEDSLASYGQRHTCVIWHSYLEELSNIDFTNCINLAERLTDLLGLDDNLMETPSEKRNIYSDQWCLITFDASQIASMEKQGRPSVFEASNHPWHKTASFDSEENMKYGYTLDLACGKCDSDGVKERVVGHFPEPRKPIKANVRFLGPVRTPSTTDENIRTFSEKLIEKTRDCGFFDGFY